jgi:hypothetical protein
MAKKPYIKGYSSKDLNSEIESNDPVLNPAVGKLYGCTHGNENENNKETSVFKKILESAKNNLRKYRAVVNPEDCVDGSCDTVYIPVIILAYQDEGTNQEFPTLEAYSKIKTQFENLNKTFNGQEWIPQTTNTNYGNVLSTGIQAYTGLTASEVQNLIRVNADTLDTYTYQYYVDSMGNKQNTSLVNLLSFGLHFNQQIWSNERRDYENVLVAFAELREIYPNIQFFFPDRLEADQFINGNIIPEFNSTGVDSGCGVSISEIVSFLNFQAAPYSNADYLYFDKDTPGLVVQNINTEFNLEFYRKLNYLQKLINGNNIGLNTDTHYHAGYTYYGPLGNTIFDNYAIMYKVWDDVYPQTWSASYSPYQMKKTIRGLSWMPAPHIILHELGHIHGYSHSFEGPVLGGKGATQIYIGSDGFVNTYNLGVGITRGHYGTEAAFVDILEPGFKPPFIYSKPNLIKEKLQTAYDARQEVVEYLQNLTEAQYREEFNAPQSLTYFKNQVTGGLAELEAAILETSDTIDYNYFNISEDEKGYIEFLINRAVPYYTSNFTRKFTFTSGTATTSFRRNVNKNGVKSLGEYKRTNLPDVLPTLYSGVQSFWGGSIVFNDESLMNTVTSPIVFEPVAVIDTLTVGDTYEGGIIYKIDTTTNEVSIATSEDFSEDLSLPDGLDAAKNSVIGGYNDWNLPSRDELELLYNTIGNGGPDGNIGGFSSSYYWSSFTFGANGGWAVDFSDGSLKSKWEGLTYKIRFIRQIIVDTMTANYPEIGDFSHGGYVFEVNNNNTGLVIEVPDSPRSNLPNSIAFAASADINSYSDWRLPTLEELSAARSYVGQLADNVANFQDLPYWVYDGKPLTSHNSALYMDTGSVSTLNTSASTIPLALVREVNFNEEDLNYTVKSYEEKFIEVLQNNPDASTSFVVNPENDLQERRGPNVTTRIPFCVQADGTPSEDLTLNTKFDPFWAHNYNAFNPAYPEYPANTKVEDLLNDEYCPCLREAQTYYDNSPTPYEYTVIKEGSNAQALHRIYKKNALTINFYGNETFNISGGKAKITMESEEQTVAHGSATDGAIEHYLSHWILNTVSKHNTNNDISTLKLHEYSNGDYLELPTFSGYCGAGGHHSVLPIAFTLNVKKAFESIPDSSYLAYLYNAQQDVPDEYFMGRQVEFCNDDLRILSIEQAFGDGVTDSPIYPINEHHYNYSRYPSTNNVERRYGIGFEDPNNSLYNPLRKYANETIDYLNGAANTVMSNSDLYGASLNANTIEPKYNNTAEFVPKVEYYRDFYGEYSPLNLSQVMNYTFTGVNTHGFIPTKGMAKKLNYYYNNLNNPVASIFKFIHDYNVGITNTKTVSDFKTLFTFFSNMVKSIELDSLEGCTDAAAINYDSNALVDDGSCIAATLGCTETWADNYNSDANRDDGSCFAEICTDPTFSGDFTTGYNLDLINTIQGYNPGAVVSASNEYVYELDASDNSVCQTLVSVRNNIIKVICSGGSNNATQACNYNPIIRYFKDSETEDIKNFTTNPVLVEEPYNEFIIKMYSSYNSPILYRTLDTPILESGEDFPSTLTEYDPINGSSTSHITNYYKLFLSVPLGYSYSLNSSVYAPIRYNCVENPIHPDGTGGCFIYTPNQASSGISEASVGSFAVKMSGCVFPPIQGTNEYLCGVGTLFDGGVLTDADLFNSDEITIESYSECAGTSTPGQYIIAGDMATSYGAAAINNGIKILQSELPTYSKNQLDSYPAADLNSSQIPSRRSRTTEELTTEPIEENVTSGVLVVACSVLLCKEDGTPFVGKFMYTQNILTGVKIYYSYDNLTESLGEQLYIRNQLLRNANVKLTAQELYFKKFSKVINKIINLTTFATN